MKTIPRGVHILTLIFVVDISLRAACIYNGHEYAITSKNLNWTSAEKQAQAWGGHLATINDSAEQAWLHVTFPASGLWIGLNDMNLEGTFGWISGEPVTYLNWDEGEPNNSGGNSGVQEDVTVMNWSGDGRWNDVPLTDARAGIMERSITTPIIGDTHLELVEPGTSVHIGIQAFGLSALNYQWRLNGTDLVDSDRISGARSSQISIINLQSSDEGYYSVVVSDLEGSTASRPVFLPVPGSIGILYYINDFEGTIGPEWSIKTTDIAPKGQRRFLGQFANENVRQMLTNVPPHTEVRLSLDVFLIGSWDGNNTADGPDVWEISVDDGPILLRTTFETYPSMDQAYPGQYPGSSYSAFTGATEVDTLGFIWGNGLNKDSVYHLDFHFTHGSSNLVVRLRGVGLTGVADESWGLDNVIVQLYSVPTNSPPAIVLQPESQLVQIGETKQLKALASGPMPLSYQWLKDAIPIINATNSTLILKYVGPAALGRYSIEARNSSGNAISAEAEVRLLPAIVRSPESKVSLPGTNIVFSVEAIGSEPLRYQWFKDGIELLESDRIKGSHGPKLALYGVIPDDIGSYIATVSNVYGSVISPSALLTTDANKICPDLLWVKRAGGQGYDLAAGIAVDHGGNFYVSGSFQGPRFDEIASGSSGEVDYLAKYSPSGELYWAQKNDNRGVVSGRSLALDGFGNVYFCATIQKVVQFGHFNLTNMTSYSDPVLVKYRSDGTALWVKQITGTSQHYQTGLAVDKTGNSYIVGHFMGRVILDTTNLTSRGNYDTYVASYDTDGGLRWAQGIGGTGQDYGFGVAVDDQGNSVITGNFEGTSTFGNTNVTTTGRWDIYVAKISTTGKVLWARDAGGINWDQGCGIATDGEGNSYVTGQFDWSAGFGGTKITSFGGYNSDSFLAKYGPDGDLRWAKNLGGIGSDNGRAVTVDAQGRVWVLAQTQSPYCVVDAITLTPSPSTNRSFLAIYSFDGTLIATRSLDGVTWPMGNCIAFGPEQSTYLIGTLTEPSSVFGTFSVTNAGSRDLLVLKMGIPLGISKNPESVVAGPGETISFTASAEGIATAVYQWFFNGTELVDNGRIKGCQSAQLTIDKVELKDAGFYAVVVYNIYGNVSSTPSLLTVLEPPAIISQPQNLNIPVCANAIFSVTATGTEPLQYQWVHVGTRLWGQTNKTLALNYVTPSDMGEYAVLVGNAAGSITSSPAQLSITSDPPYIIQQPREQRLRSGLSLSLSASATGWEPISYQWFFNYGPIAGANQFELLIDSAQTNNSGSYYLQASNYFGVSTSATATVTVFSPLKINAV